MSAAPNTQDDQPLLYTVGQVAAKLGFSKTKTWELIMSGDIRSLKIGGSRRVRPGDLVEYVNSLSNES